MPTWTDYSPGTDLLARTARVLDPTGRIVTAGTVSRPSLMHHVDDPTRLGVELIPDPDAEGLDERARDRARRALAYAQHHADTCPCPDVHTGGIGVGLEPGYRLQLLEREG